MATAHDKLNNLLEDALDDLLDNDQEGPESTPQAGPNIKESLSKISQVTGGCQTDHSKQTDVKTTKKVGNKNKRKNDINNPGTSTVKDSATANADERPPPTEEDMNKFFESMITGLMTDLPKPESIPNPEEVKANIEDSVPQIFSLMQNLLSKELLYPSLKDLSGKFDAWLEKNSASLDEQDSKRYRQQRDIIYQILSVFDDESIVPQERFEKNLDLMSKMQELGSPPQELTVNEGIDRCLQDSLNDKCSVM